MKTETILFLSFLLGLSLCSSSTLLKPTSDSSNEVERKVKEVSQCGLTISKSLCVDNGNAVLAAPAAVDGLAGYWSFDEELPLDQSGNRNNAVGEFAKGLSLFKGNSALFNGNFLEVPFNESMQSDNWTFTFWIYLEEDGEVLNDANTFCPLIQKGVDDKETNTYHRSPRIVFNRAERSIRVMVSSESEASKGEYFDSNARLLRKKWYNISVKKDDRKLFLFVNGILDSHSMIKNKPKVINESLYIGSTPESAAHCAFSYNLDEVKLYTKPLSEQEIQNQASLALGGIEPAAVQLGCTKCSIGDASSVCSPTYHVCNTLELYGIAYNVARSLGWATSSSNIWSSSDLENAEELAGIEGLAICCRN